MEEEEGENQPEIVEQTTPQTAEMEWHSNNVISIFGKKRSGKSMFAKVVLWPHLTDVVLYDLKFRA